MTEQSQSKDLGLTTTRWRVSVKRTVNLGNYESITLEAGVEENIPEGKLQSEHVDFMFQKVNKVLDKEFLNQEKNIG